MTAIGDFTIRDGGGADLSLSRFAGQVLLVVNTASKCGFTPQYAGLEALQREFGPRGFSVLAFPCNQFGGQEPGDDPEIAAFCRDTYGVTFPVFARIEVNGPGAHPLFQWLRREKRGLFGTSRIKWNFTKFLIDRDGRPVRRYAPFAKPESLRRPIERLL
jgi:glutathione peroxidase